MIAHERRKYSRFLAQDDTFVALGRDFSKVGKIKDISMGGLAFEYISDEKMKNTDDSVLDIFLSEHEFHISKVPCEVVYDMPIREPDITFLFIKTFIMNRCGVKFGTLTEHHRRQLKFFLKNYTLNLLRYSYETSGAEQRFSF
ncbi:PilZ domain-containing protein [Desulfonema magnum]|uniref:PilZ domain-containing protein n=1 Tax=Desulfonema magnum TaxID=45655 RepID=A0A975BVY7_9BACT|nr:PilZ domain-containing protein [Desulfonema magnum]QTA92140.1 PilZ domain-containing protein [Desulfonema magnum]